MHSDSKLALSVIVPLFNEQDSLEKLHRRFKEVLTSQIPSHEIIFVDDGSRDSSFEILQKLAAQDERVKVVQFQKNYGKSAALSMGFRLAKGEIVVTLDADLQDDPAEIPKLIAKLDEGYDLVSGWKRKRRDPLSKTIPSRIFNFVTSLFSGLQIHDINCGLKVYRRAVVENLHPYGELHRFLPLLAHLDGFRIGEVVVEHHPRQYGRTKFGSSRFLSGFFDLITVMFLTRYMRKPLHLFGIVGLLSFIAGFAISLYLTILRLSGHWIGNRPLFFLGILLLILGVQFISIGLIGEMISESQKTRQDYAIRTIVGFDENS